MMVPTDMGCFHLLMETIGQLPQAADKAVHLNQQRPDQRNAHRPYPDKYGQDMPEIGFWSWSRTD